MVTVALDDGNFQLSSLSYASASARLSEPMGGSSERAVPSHNPVLGSDANVGTGVRSALTASGLHHTSQARSRSKVTTGSGGTSSLLKPAPRGRNWIWVGGLDRGTTLDNVTEHVKSLFPGNDVLVFDLKSKSRSKSFKVGSSDLSVVDLSDSRLWPDGLLVRPFRQLPKN